MHEKSIGLIRSFNLVSWVLSGISLVIFGIGLPMLIHRRANIVYIVYFGLLLLAELAGIITSFYGLNNLIILSASAYFHFAFLVCLYLRSLYGLSFQRIALVIISGSIPFLISTISNYWRPVAQFQSFDRIAYGFIITILSLSYFYISLTERNRRPDSRAVLLNTSILFCFSLDTFLAIGTNYFVNAGILFVAWFWFLRSVLFQFYYIVLIRYLWKVGKIPLLHSYG